jgi:formylglycine-generating enzyme required for sulfatase activity
MKQRSPRKAARKAAREKIHVEGDSPTEGTAQPAVPMSAEQRRGHQDSVEEIVQGTVFSDRLAYAVLALVCVYCHGFILTNDGPVWDGWYWVNWLQNRNWAPMVEYTRAQGLQTTLWLFGLFAYFPDVIGCGMFASVLCFFVESVLVYRFALAATRLNKVESLAISSLSLAVPFFNAAQDFPVIGLLFFRMLFVGAALCAVRSTDVSGDNLRHVLWRLSALGLFVLCCVTNGALLVYYGGFYLLLLNHEQRKLACGWMAGALHFVKRYPDYLLLPPLTYAGRLLFVKQFGWYETYNMPTSDWMNFWPNLGSFFRHVPTYHFANAWEWIGNHPLWSLAGVLGLVGFGWRARNWNLGARSPVPSFGLAAFGVLLFAFAIVPLALVGKVFYPNPIRLHSRHCVLMSVPVAIVLFSFLRSLLWRSGGSAHVAFLPLTAGCILWMGTQLNRAYVIERLDWIYSRSVQLRAVSDPRIRDSSIILTQNYSVTGLPIYDLYGFASAFGAMNHLVTPLPPENRRFYTPFEIHFMLHMTSVLPGEFKKIDPSGRQILLHVTRKKQEDAPLQMVWGYLRAKWSGDKDLMKTFLEPLTAVEVQLIREKALRVGGVSRDVESPPTGIPDASFSNGAGMSMVHLPEKWWAGKTEVAQKEFESIMGFNPSVFLDPQRPVECVSWNEAMEFCKRLTESEGKAGRLPPGHVYRLPTVDEWDRLAQGTPLTEGISMPQDPLWHTEPVGSKPSNSLGLHDVSGSVWEWCLDWADTRHLYKISKGGSWVSYDFTLRPYAGDRSQLRDLSAVAVDRLFGPARRDYPDQGFWDRGFRCVLAPPVEAGVLQ